MWCATPALHLEDVVEVRGVVGHDLDHAVARGPEVEARADGDDELPAVVPAEAQDELAGEATLGLADVLLSEGRLVRIALGVDPRTVVVDPVPVVAAGRDGDDVVGAHVLRVLPAGAEVQVVVHVARQAALALAGHEGARQGVDPRGPRGGATPGHGLLALLEVGEGHLLDLLGEAEEHRLGGGDGTLGEGLTEAMTSRPLVHHRGEGLAAGPGDVAGGEAVEGGREVALAHPALELVPADEGSGGPSGAFLGQPASSTVVAERTSRWRIMATSRAGPLTYHARPLRSLPTTSRVRAGGEPPCTTRRHPAEPGAPRGVLPPRDGVAGRTGGREDRPASIR